jgi:hypothetical protein
MLVVLVLSWATLAVFLIVFLRMALRPDAGFGAAGRGRKRPHGLRPGGTPAAVRH